MGVVFLPSRVTGFSAMSRRQMMMFMEGRQRRENSSQWAGWPGEDWRLILRRTFFSAIRTSVERVISFQQNGDQETDNSDQETGLGAILVPRAQARVPVPQEPENPRA